MRCHKGNLLINAATRIRAANGEHIDCWGFLPVTMIWRRNLSVKPVFICPSMEDVFVGFAPRKALEMATAEFPEASASDIDQQSDATKGVIGSNSMETSKDKPAEREPPLNKPDHIPFEPTLENIPCTENWFRHAFAKSAFSVTAAPMPSMQGPKMKIHLHPGATLKTVHTQIPVPFHWEKVVKELLDRDVRSGVLEKVPEGTPSRCCTCMAVVQKRDGTPRRTVDLQSLNRECLRETHYIQAPFHLVNQIPPTPTKRCWMQKMVIRQWS